MQTQTIQFATITKNGVVQKVGSIKWYEDKKKADK